MEQEKRPIRYEHYCIVVVSTVILASMLLCWSMLLPFSAFLFVVAISEILLMPRYLKVSYSCRRPSSLVQDWLLLFCALGSFIFERPEFPNHLFYVGIMAFAFADLSVWINDKWKHSIVVSPFSFLHIVPHICNSYCPDHSGEYKYSVCHFLYFQCFLNSLVYPSDYLLQGCLVCNPESIGSESQHRYHYQFFPFIRIIIRTIPNQCLYF